MSKKCSIASCSNPAVCADLCKNCYAGMHYWQRKGVAATMRRKHQLTVLQDRLDAIGPANVVRFKRKRAA